MYSQIGWRNRLRFEPIPLLPKYSENNAQKILYYHINDSIHPNGVLEMNYNEKQWLINDEDLLSFIQKVAGVTPTE